MIRKIYRSIRSRAPRRMQVALSKFTFSLMNRPRVDTTDRIPLDRAIVTTSADLELAWAWRYAKANIDAIALARRERAHVPILLDAFNARELPITWATVGHLFLDGCERVNGKAHPDMPRPHYFENEHWSFRSGDWYDCDPCSSYTAAPEYYAPDIVERILSARVAHEIGSHSFSHCDFSERNSTPELIEAELIETNRAMQRFGIAPASFVFPGNQYGNFALLKKHGYRIARSRRSDASELGWCALHESGITTVHDSMAFDVDEDGWKSADVMWRVRRLLSRAIDAKAICHFWFHPSISEHDMRGILFPAIDAIVDARDRGLIEVRTMKQLIPEP